MSVEIIIPSSSQALLKRLKDPSIALGAVCRAIDQENQYTIAHITSRYLSYSKAGPSQPDGLRVITNTLRKSIRASKAAIVPGGVISGIGSNVKYAALHEFGFTGEVRVNSFIRRSPQGDRFQIGGRQLSRRLASKLGLTKRTPQTRSGVSTVRAHLRRMKLRARAPIQHGIADRMQDYGNAVSRAITRAWGATQ